MSDYVYNNLLRNIIDEFKQKDLDNIKYEFSEQDIAKARVQLSLYCRDLEAIPDCEEETPTVEDFLRPQKEILPVKQSRELMELYSFITLMNVNDLLKQLKDLIINEDNSYVICNSKVLDNERMLTWGFTANFFYGSFNNFSNIKIRYDNPGIIDNNTHDILVAGVVDFIYSNVKLGLL